MSRTSMYLCVELNGGVSTSLIILGVFTWQGGGESMPENVHMDSVGTGLARRIGAALAATLGVWVILNLVSYTILFPLHLVFGPPQTEIWWPGYVYLILNPVFLYILLKRWRKCEENGGRAWFSTIHPLYFVLVISVLFIIDAVIPIVYSFTYYRVFDTMPFHMQDYMQRHVTVVLRNHANVGASLFFLFGRNASANTIVFSLLSLSAMFAQGIFWLWWCDRASRRIVLRAAAAGAWIAFSFLAATYQPAIGFGHDAAGQVRVFIDWREDHLDMFPTFTINTIIFGVGILILYILAARILDARKIRTRELA